MLIASVYVKGILVYLIRPSCYLKPNFSKKLPVGTGASTSIGSFDTG